MGIIYKEMVRHKKISALKGTMLVFLLMLTLNILVNSSHYSSKYNIEMEIISMAGGLLVIVMLKTGFDIAYIRRICYMYKLIDKELIFERVVGNSKRVILSIDMKDVELFTRVVDARKLKDIDRTYKFLCSPSKKSIYCCVVNDKGKRVRVCFQPSDELVNKLKKVMEDNTRKSIA